MSNRRTFRILVVLITIVLQNKISFCANNIEELWTGSISDVRVADTNEKISKINIILERDEKIDIPFEQSRTISVETNQLERSTKVYLDGINPAAKINFFHKGDKIISTLKISRISGSILNPNIQILNDGISVYSTLIDMTTNKPTSVTVISKEKERQVEITMSIEPLKEQDLSMQIPHAVDIDVAEFDDPLSQKIGIGLDRKILQKMKPYDFITAVFELQHIDPGTAKTIVQNEISSRGRVQVYADKSHLIVTDTVSYIKSIKNLIESIDKKIPQVLIEARIFEITYGTESEVGIDWTLTREDLTATIAHKLNTAVRETRGSEFVVSGLLRDQYTDTLFATIDTLVSEGKARIVARPKVVVLNNQKAVITSGEGIPYRKEMRDTTAGTQYFINDFMQTGITLTVTPSIRNNGLIVLKAKPEVKYIVGYKGEYDMPVFSNRSTDTTVSMRDGDTLVIGGLFKEGEETIEHGIPLLKDIPILGLLFRHKKEINIKTEVVICITTTFI